MSMAFHINISGTTVLTLDGPVSGRDVLLRSGNMSSRNIVAWRVNNYLRSLDWIIDEDSSVEFVDTSSFEGMEVYRRSLSFLLVMASRKALAEEIVIRHSISDGYYWELENRALTAQDVQSVKSCLDEMVGKDIPIKRELLPLDKATRLFRNMGSCECANLFQWSNVDPVEVYRCVDEYGFFYAPLAPSTGYLKVYDLKLLDPGMVLQFPTVNYPDKVPPFHPSRKLSEVFLEYAHWLETLGLNTMDSLHLRISEGKALELVLVSEALHSQRLSRLAEDISSRENLRLISIAGPSGSGKTTTAQRLKIQLQVCGKKPLTISLDDFFLDRKDTPLDENGGYDFDTLEALDLDLLNSTLEKLFKGQAVTLPVFDFFEGKKRPGPTLQLKDENILIIEGIHGLNQRLSSSVPEDMKFKLFVSPLTGISFDRHNRTSTTDNRLFRRLVRDYRKRGHSVSATLEQWPSVIRGSMKYVFPFQDQADAMFNSSLPYELGVLKGYVEPILHTVPQHSPVYGEALRLLSMLRYIPIIPSENVPKNSILREFIGGSSFEA